MALFTSVCLLFAIVPVILQAPVDDERFRDSAVGKRVRRAKVELPLSRFSVVNWHNYLRGKALASNMEYVHYSEALAERALWWARKCQYDYAPPEEQPFRSDTLRTTANPLQANYGQNIYHVAKNLDDNELIEKALNSWYDESRVYLPENDTCLIASCRQYKQLMWAPVRAVGCAAVRCDRLRDTNGVNFANELFLVCNYDKQQRDVPAYLRGYPCSSCSRQQEIDIKCYQGLCRRDSVGEPISPSENLLLDPPARKSTGKARVPTLPADIIMSWLNISKQAKPDLLGRSPSFDITRSVASPPITRSPSAERSTSQSVEPFFAVSDSLSNGRSSRRELFTSNMANTRSSFSTSSVLPTRTSIEAGDLRPRRTEGVERTTQMAPEYSWPAAGSRRPKGSVRSTPQVMHDNPAATVAPRNQ